MGLLISPSFFEQTSEHRFSNRSCKEQYQRCRTGPYVQRYPAIYIQRKKGLCTGKQNLSYRLRPTVFSSCRRSPVITPTTKRSIGANHGESKDFLVSHLKHQHPSALLISGVAHSSPVFIPTTTFFHLNHHLLPPHHHQPTHPPLNCP